MVYCNICDNNILVDKIPKDKIDDPLCPNCKSLILFMSKKDFKKLNTIYPISDQLKSNIRKIKKSEIGIFP